MKIFCIFLALSQLVFVINAQNPILDKLKWNEDVWFPAFKGGKMGYINVKGQEVADFNIEPVLKFELRNFAKDFIIIKYDKETIAYTKKAKPILDDGYADITYDENSNLFRVLKKGAAKENDYSISEIQKLGYFTLDGKQQIAPNFSCGLFDCGYGFNDGLCYMSKDKKIGFVNLKGEWVIQPAYYYTNGFSNGYAVMVKEKDGNNGVINTKGEVVVPFNYHNINAYSSNGIAAATINKEDASVLIDSKGRIKVTLKNLIVASFFSTVMRFNNNNLVVYNKITKKFGIINEAGKGITNTKYSGISIPNNTNLMVANLDGIKAKNDSWYETSGNKWVIVDATTGKEICSPIEAVKLRGVNEGMIAFFKNDKWGFLNDKGKVVIPPTYEYEPSAFTNGLARIYGNNPSGFSTDYSIGYIDKTGKEIWPLQK